MTTILTAYKLNKKLTNSLDLFDLLEAYYPEKHNTIVRMRNIAYRELAETGVLTADGINASYPDPLYKTILNTHIPTNWFSCSPNTIIEAVDKLRSQIDLLPPVYLIDEGVESDLFNVGERLSFRWFPFTQAASHLELVGRFIQDLIKDIENDVDIIGLVKKRLRLEATVHIPEYINNIEEGVKFCDRYNISYIVSSDNKLNVTNPPDITCHEKFRSMEAIARKIDGFVVDHPNCYLNNFGQLIVTFSPYDGELREKEQVKLRRKGYDIRQCDFDLYGYGTKTFVMAELVSPLD